MSTTSNDHEYEPGADVSPEMLRASIMEQNGTGTPSPLQVEQMLIGVHGECRRRSKLAGRPQPHDWHPVTGEPVRTPQSIVFGRMCCYCAPEGLGIVVRTTITEEQIKTESLRHGPRLIFEQIKPVTGGLTLPGQPGYVPPPEMR